MTNAVADVNKLILMLQADQIYTPKALMRMGLHERSILLVSEIITDYRFKSMDEVKKIIEDLPDEYIFAYAYDDVNIAKRIKRDTKKVLNNWNKIFSKKDGENIGKG